MLYILHQVNCQNAFGAGFAGYLNRTFPLAKQTYHHFVEDFLSSGEFQHDLLGQIAEAPAEEFTVIHVFGQYFYGNARKTGKCYTNYEAVEIALSRFRDMHPDDKAICPQFMGCGLAGGDWERYSAILAKYNIIPCKDINLANHTFVRASK